MYKKKKINELKVCTMTDYVLNIKLNKILKYQR